MSPLPLEGIRVLDLTHVWAGPYCTKLLGDMGAEIVRVESIQRPAGTRAVLADNDPGERPWNRSCYFNKVNRNKYGVTLDLNSGWGMEILHKLIKISDVLAESFSPGTMKKWSLEYEQVKAIKEDIVMISLSGFGQTGPYSRYGGYGMGLEPMSGLSYLTGYKDGWPMRTGVSYCDPTSGIVGAVGVMTALHYRQRTGKGQYVDLSERESIVPLIGEFIMDYSMNGRVNGRQGNEKPPMAPHGVYPCKGEDMWVTIAVSSDEEWKQFCQAIGDPAWTKDEMYADGLSRWHNRAELDKHVAEWTVERDHYDVMHLLQKAGVAAGAVMTNKEMLLDPHFKDRGFFEIVDHKDTGKRPYPGMTIKFSKTPGWIRMPGHGLGEHNEHVLGQLLGMTKDELDTLAEAQIIGTEPLNRRPGGKYDFEMWKRKGIIMAGYDEDYKKILGLE